MTFVKSRPWWAVILVYAAAGSAIGLALPALKGMAASSMGRSGLAVAFAVNIAMPVVVVMLAAAYPRLWVALLGTLLATIAFVLTGNRALPSFQSGWLVRMIQAASPILVVACIAYHVLAGMTVGVVRTWRRVGTPPDPNACPTCGYSLVGLTEPRCPECFAPCTPRGNQPAG